MLSTEITCRTIKRQKTRKKQKKGLWNDQISPSDSVHLTTKYSHKYMFRIIGKSQNAWWFMLLYDLKWFTSATNATRWPKYCLDALWLSPWLYSVLHFFGNLRVKSSKFMRRDQKTKQAELSVLRIAALSFLTNCTILTGFWLESKIRWAWANSTSPRVPGCIARQLYPGCMTDAILPSSVNGASVCFTVTAATFTTAATTRRWRKTTGLHHLTLNHNIERVFWFKGLLPIIPFPSV